MCLSEVNDPTPKYNDKGEPLVRNVEGVDFYLDYLNTEEGDVAYSKGNPVAGEQGRFMTNFIASHDGNAYYTGGSDNLNEHVMMQYREFTGGFDVVLKQTEVGYNVEAKIRMSSQLKKRLAEEENPSIGLGVQLNDDTNDSFEGDNSGRDKVLFSFVGIDGEWSLSSLPYGGSRGFPNMYLLNEDMEFFTVTVPRRGYRRNDHTGSHKSRPRRCCEPERYPRQRQGAEKKGSLKVNGQAIDQKFFTMPYENVTITAEFVDRSYDNDPNTIKIISQNILNDANSTGYQRRGNKSVSNTTRARRMGELLGNEIHADSIGFQEVLGGGRGWAKLLAENFPDYDYVGFGRDFTGSNDTIREDYANDVSSGEATPIFYLRDRSRSGGIRYMVDLQDPGHQPGRHPFPGG